MNTLREELSFLNMALIGDLQSSFRVNNINASGKLSGTLAHEVKIFKSGDILVEVTAEGYVFSVEEGVAPEEAPPLDELVPALLRWIEDKQIDSDLDDDSLAYAIAISIQRKGTLAYQFTQQTGQGTGVLSEVITQDRINEYIGLVADFTQNKYLEAVAKLQDRNNGYTIRSTSL